LAKNYSSFYPKSFHGNDIVLMMIFYSEPETRNSKLDWPQTCAEALACQQSLCSQVRLQPLPAPPRLVAGVDASYSRTDRKIYGAAVVLSLPELALIDAAGVSGPVPFPYIPGLLTFREAPILLAALQQLRRPPDVILVDGQGIAHPRGLGLAAHLGLLANIPTIGCAKSRLWGTYGELDLEQDSLRPLSTEEKQIGWVLRSRRNCRPLFISPGHLVTLAESLALTRQCLGKYRLPLPLREAHLLSQRLRRQSAGHTPTDISADL
jgi:deoxyribonuclease V